MDALLLDFNGTLSDDEDVLCRIFQELFAELGRPLSERDYFGRLVGLSDEETVAAWLGPRHPAAAEVIERKVIRYRELVADGSTVTLEAREAVLWAAEHTAVAVVSGAAREQIEPVLAASGLAGAVDAIVADGETPHGKPAPDPYLRALKLLDVSAGSAAAVEDTDAGVASAKAAGLYCAAVTTTLPSERLHAADEVAPRLDRALVERLNSRK